jgi:glycolate oxidase FAD binding subunit
MLDRPAPLRPRDAADVLQIVRDAAAEQRALEILGHGTRREIGHVAARQVVDLSELSGVTLYEPDEIVLSARAGTPLAEIDTLLAAQNQELAFEPVDFGPLFGRPRGSGTIGGALASNLSGPRRVKAGAARDHVLGIGAVSGRGEEFKSGGRVVKNVTGYDLSKGMAGSWGTLAVLTDVTFKVLPRGEASSTLAIFGLDDCAGIDVLCAAMGSAGEVSGAAYLPVEAAAKLAPFASSNRSVTLLRLEGFRPSVVYRAERIAGMVGGAPREIVRIDDDDSVALWRSIRDVEPFAGRRTPLWRVSVAPMAGPHLIALLQPKLALEHFYDWSGGLVWIDVTQPSADAGAEAIRSAIRATGGGHATLIRPGGAAESVRRFEPQAAPLAALAARLKSQFDPVNILNPGRMG